MTPKGKLTVNTSPVIGLIYVDGALVAQGHYSDQVSIGDHTVSFGDTSIDTPASQTVEIKANQEMKVSGVYTVTQENLWAEIDKQFKKTMYHAEHAYRTNYIINLIIVAIGIVLVGSSLFFSITRGLDISTLTYAGLGIADFVALFLVNPQRRIQQLIGDLSQIGVIYRTWRAQLSSAEGYLWNAPGNPRTLNLDEIKNLNTELNRIAAESLSAIETFIGTEPTKKSSQ